MHGDFSPVRLMCFIVQSKRSDRSIFLVILPYLNSATAERLKVFQMVKNLPANQETQVLILGQDSLEKGMAIYSNILAWRIPWTKELDRL